MEIKIIRQKQSKEELEKLAQANYGEMIKGVADLGRQIIALGGELHADAEEILLEDGSEQKFLWGFNIFTNRTKEQRLEYNSFINIRPGDNNFTLEVQSVDLKKQIKLLIDKWVE